MGIGAHHEDTDVMNTGSLKEGLGHIPLATLHGRELRPDVVPG